MAKVVPDGKYDASRIKSKRDLSVSSSGTEMGLKRLV